MAKSAEKKEPNKIYPSWRYNGSGDSIVVYSPEEDEALGLGWEDSPGKFGIITAPSAEDIRKAKLAKA